MTDREKDSIYANSARLFAGQGLIEDAFAAVRSIGNERFRGLMETAVRQYAVEQAAKREDARTAYQYAKEEPTEARVHMFVMTIDASLRKKDREFACLIVMARLASGSSMNCLGWARPSLPT